MQVSVKLALVYAVVMASIAFAQDSGGQRWATAVATRPTDSHKMIYRYISEFKPGFDQLDFPERATLEWRYRSDSGLPSKAEMQAMDRFEDQLEAKLASRGQLVASLVVVSTGEGRRRWTYYVKSNGGFLEDLRSVNLDNAVPVESHVDHDQDWTLYKSFVSGVQR